MQNSFLKNIYPKKVNNYMLFILRIYTQIKRICILIWKSHNFTRTENKVLNLRGKQYCRRNLWFERRDEWTFERYSEHITLSQND